MKRIRRCKAFESEVAIQEPSQLGVERRQDNVIHVTVVIYLGNFSEKSKNLFCRSRIPVVYITKNIRLYNIVSFTSRPFAVNVEGLVPVLPLTTHPAPGPTTSLHWRSLRPLHRSH